MWKRRIPVLLTLATILCLAVVASAPIASAQYSRVRLMSHADMIATFGDILIDYEAISKPCDIVQFLGSSSSTCYFCYGDGSRKVCCACTPQQSGLCSDTSTVACNGVTCMAGTALTGPPNSCGTPACGKTWPTGTCGGSSSLCPTYDKTGSCSAPPG